MEISHETHGCKSSKQIKHWHLPQCDEGRLCMPFVCVTTVHTDMILFCLFLMAPASQTMQMLFQALNGSDEGTCAGCVGMRGISWGRGVLFLSFSIWPCVIKGRPVKFLQDWRVDLWCVQWVFWFVWLTVVCFGMSLNSLSKLGQHFAQDYLGIHHCC